MLAAGGEVGGLEHVVEGAVHVGDRAQQPVVLMIRVLGDQAADVEMGLMHHGHAHAAAGVETDSRQAQG